MKIKSILSALLLMASSVASAQYLNVKLEDGTYRSFKTTPNMKVSFGEKAGAEIMEPIQMLKLYKGDQLVAEYWDYEIDRVVYEEKPLTTGTANAIINNVETPVKWVQLWKNGPKFAEFNVGATSETDCGGYYAWGGNQDVQSVTNPTYNTGTSTLTGPYDTATKLWGSKWRMPTKEEFEALLNNCTCTWTIHKGVNGLLCRGKKDTTFENNIVFLPAAGNCVFANVGGQGGIGRYWSSTPSGSLEACSLTFGSAHQDVSFNDRGLGFSVRAVLAE